MSDENSAHVLPQVSEPTGKSVRNNEKIERYLELIKEHLGNVAEVARQEGVTRTVCKTYIDSKPELVAALHDIRQDMVDTAETNVFKAVKQGDLGTSKMLLPLLGKDRGWAPRQEVTGEDGKDLIPTTIVFTTYAEEPEEEAASDVDGTD